MKKQFYQDLLEIEELFAELDRLDLAPHEKAHLITIIHSSIHTVVLDVVLREIPKEDKHLFLEHVHTSTHRDTWKFLTQRSVNIEDKIRKAVKEVQKEFITDIRNLKG